MFISVRQCLHTSFAYYFELVQNASASLRVDCNCPPRGEKGHHRPMKRLCKFSIAIVAVAYTFSDSTASSVGWTRSARHAAVGRAQRGTVSCLSPSTTESEGFHLEDYQAASRHPRRSLLALRGGCSTGESGGDSGGGGGSGGEKNVAAGADGETVGETGGAGGSTGIDEDLYSRQLYVMGKSAMVKMGKADVLISGMRSESTGIGDKIYNYMPQ